MGNQLANPRRVIIASCLGLLLFTISKTTYSQDWIAKYDSLISEYDKFLENGAYSDSYTTALKALNISTFSKDFEREFESFILSVESLLTDGKLFKSDSLLQEFQSEFYDELNSFQKSKLLSTFGWLNFELGNFEASFSNAEQALLFAKQIQDSSRLEAAYRIQSFSALELGYPDRAIDLGKKAINYNDNDFYRYLVYLNLFNSYLQNGESTISYNYLEYATSIAKRLNSPHLITRGYINIADYHLLQRNFSIAIDHLLKGISEIKDIPDSHAYLSKLYLYIGDMYSSIKQHELALLYYRRALSYYKIENERNYRFNYILHRLANSELNTGNIEEAETLIQELLETYVKSNDSTEYARALITNAEILYAHKNYNESYKSIIEAKEYFGTDNVGLSLFSVNNLMIRLPNEFISQDTKIKLAHDLINKSSELNLYQDQIFKMVSELYYESGIDSAIFYAEQALEIIENQPISGYEFKAKVFSENAQFYKELGSWYAEKNELEKTFELFERSKSRVLISELSQNQRHNNNELRSSSKKLTLIRSEIDRLYQETLNFDIDDSTYIELANKNVEYELLLDSLNRSENSSNSLSVISLSQAQNYLDDNSAFIHYGLNDNELFSFLISKDTIIFNTSGYVEDFSANLNLDISSFREAIMNKMPSDDLNSEFIHLSEKLLGPIYHKLGEIDNLIIIPDGSLNLLPFEALIYNDKYLIESTRIKYLPSISSYPLFESHLDYKNKSLYAVAGSQFENQNLLLNSEAKYTSLPFTLLEVDTIADHFTNATVSKDFFSYLDNNNEDLSSFSNLHFATHAVIDEVFPEQSGLVFDNTTSEIFDGINDGYLNTREIRSMNLNAELVVLSACNTATGKIYDGEGLISLNRAFLTAGASSVISGLWSIYDQSSHDFMKMFYSNLFQFKSSEISILDKLLMRFDVYEPELIDYKTKALHQTKLDMIDHPYYNHPVHWASFIITGK